MGSSQYNIAKPDIKKIVPAVAEGLDLIRQRLEAIEGFDISLVYEAVADQIYKIDHESSHSDADKEEIRLMLAHLGSPVRGDIY